MTTATRSSHGRSSKTSRPTSRTTAPIETVRLDAGHSAPSLARQAPQLLQPRRPVEGTTADEHSHAGARPLAPDDALIERRRLLASGDGTPVDLARRGAD